LHEVRRELRTASLLHDISSPSAIDILEPGDFVEFRATFAPDEIIALLDVLNPQLIAGLTKWIRRNQIRNELNEAGTEEEIKAASIKYQTAPEADAELAQIVSEAIRVDFRSLFTREYFGSIQNCPDLTAVVVCDLGKFLIEDPDRILDGRFTVLGKLGTRPSEDVPILSRNKVLDRIKPAALDLAMEGLQGLAKQRIEDTKNPSSNRRMDDYLDLSFPSRIAGRSFKVLPVAIFI
jgi:hypothetical protein